MHINSKYIKHRVILKRYDAREAAWELFPGECIDAYHTPSGGTTFVVRCDDGRIRKGANIKFEGEA